MSFLDIYHGDDEPLHFRRDTLGYDEFIQQLDEMLGDDPEAPTAQGLLERIKKQATPDNYKILCDMLDFLADTDRLESDKQIATLTYELHKDEIERDVDRMFLHDPKKVEGMISVLKEAGLFDLSFDQRPNRHALSGWLKSHKDDRNEQIPNRHEIDRLLTEVIQSLKDQGVELPFRNRSASQNDKNLMLPVRNEIS